MATVDDLLLTPFSPRAGLVFWIDNVNAMTGLGEGWLANPDGCTGKHKFADAVDIWFPMGESGMIPELWTTTFTLPNCSTVSLNKRSTFAGFATSP